MLVSDLTLLESRIDYLSASAPRRQGAESLIDIAGLGLQQEQQRGERLRTWQSHGRDVARAGSWLVGSGEQDAYVQISGQDAETWARAVLDTATHCSRIDYCATVGAVGLEYNPIPSVLAVLAERYPDDDDDAKINHYRGLRHDRGITIASRASAYYARIYDKHAESGGRYPPGAWRFEVELKRHASEYEHEAYKVQPSRLYEAPTLTRLHFERWGVTVPCCEGRTLPLAVQHRAPTDAERSLTWLAQQVRPTVDWLSSVGRGADARRALGLAEQMSAQGE